MRKEGNFSPPPSTSLIKGSMMMIDIHHSALISRSKIIHLTSVSKLHPPLFFSFFFLLTFLSFFFAMPAKREPLCVSVQSVCAAAGPYTMRGFLCSQTNLGPEMRSTAPSHHALIIN